MNDFRITAKQRNEDQIIAAMDKSVLDFKKLKQKDPTKAKEIAKSDLFRAGIVAKNGKMKTIIVSWGKK